MERDLRPGFPGIPPARWSEDRSGTLWAYADPKVNWQVGVGRRTTGRRARANAGVGTPG